MLHDFVGSSRWATRVASGVLPFLLLIGCDDDSSSSVRDAATSPTGGAFGDASAGRGGADGGAATGGTAADGGVTNAGLDGGADANVQGTPDGAAAGDGGTTTADDGGLLPRVPSDGPPPAISGLLAYFPLDDATGATDAPAAETAGGLSARYVGRTSGPTRSDPGAVSFTNPAGAHFVGGDGQAVRVANAPESLRLTDSVSISLWLRTTTDGDMDLVSMGDNYGMRASGSVYMFTRGNATWHGCPGTIPVKDGLWHHAAVVKDGARVTVYLDARVAGTCDGFPAIGYDQGSDLWIGEHGNGQLLPYQGDLDDVRIYGRALSPAEILQLAGGS
jgi:hypothetical protein